MFGMALNTQLAASWLTSANSGGQQEVAAVAARFDWLALSPDKPIRTTFIGLDSWRIRAAHDALASQHVNVPGFARAGAQLPGHLSMTSELTDRRAK